MKKRILIIVLIIFMFSIVGCAGNNTKSLIKDDTVGTQLTQKEKLDDFEYMYKILKENYPYFEVNKRLNGIDWLSKKNEYISKIKSTKNDNSFFNTLNDILAELHNGHADMIDKNFYSYTKSALEKDPNQYKAWLMQLNNLKVIKRYSSMKNLGIGVQISSNKITPDNVKTNILVNEKVAYLSIHMFNNFNIDGDMKIIKPFLNNIKNYKALIIDIRGNGGGGSEYWSNNIVPMLINKPLDDTQYIAYRGGGFVEQFVKCRLGGGFENRQPISNLEQENLKNLPPELKKDFKYYFINRIHYAPQDSIGFNGKIYLLIDGNVFSSAEAFATFAKSTGFATLVGENTGGDGIGIDPAICALPNSGYIFRFPQQMGLTSDGSCDFEHKTDPDIKVSANKNSNLSNDEAVQTVLKLVN